MDIYSNSIKTVNAKNICTMHFSTNERDNILLSADRQFEYVTVTSDKIFHTK
jgi:hypothetical protein